MTTITLEELPILVILAVALHIFADFHLQGILANLKQKKWWMENVFAKGFDRKYEYDYLAALATHGFEWSVAMHLPLIFFWNVDPILLVSSILVNTVVHCIVDDLKCNKFKINLIEDQLFHLIQVILTVFILTL